MFAEHFQRTADELDGVYRGRRVILQEKLDKPLEIVKSGRRVDYARHRFGLGLVAFLPAARALT